MIKIKDKKNKQNLGIVDSYYKIHPVTNLVLRPTYKSLGGKYNPLVAMNLTGLVNGLLHVVPLMYVNDSFTNIIEKGDARTLGYTSLAILPWVVMHGYCSIKGQRKLNREKNEFKELLVGQGVTDNLDQMVKEEFETRKQEYMNTSKVYSRRRYEA